MKKLQRDIRFNRHGNNKVEKKNGRKVPKREEMLIEKKTEKSIIREKKLNIKKYIKI